MLYANSVDSDKIMKALEDVLKKATDSNQNIVLLNMRNFYRSCHLSKLQRTKFQAEVEDVLTGRELVDLYGLWVLGEYGDGMHALFQTPKSIAEFEFGENETLLKNIQPRQLENVFDEDGAEADTGEPYGHLTKWIIRFDNRVHNIAFHCTALAAVEEDAITITKTKCVDTLVSFINTGRPSHQRITDLPANFWKPEYFKIEVSHANEVLRFEFDRIDSTKPFLI